MLYQCHLSNGLMSGSHGDHILVKWSQLTRCLLGEWLQGKGSGYKGNGYKGRGVVTKGVATRGVVTKGVAQGTGSGYKGRGVVTRGVVMSCALHSLVVW